MKISFLCLILTTLLPGCGKTSSKDNREFPVRGNEDTAPTPIPSSIADPKPSNTIGTAPDSYLECLDYGHLLRLCTVNQTELAPAQESEVTFEVHYDFECEGSPVWIYLSTDTSERRVELGKDKVAKMVSKGPFKLVDPKPERTKAASFFKGCGLFIRNVTWRN